jgi:hypothetical protein
MHFHRRRRFLVWFAQTTQPPPSDASPAARSLKIHRVKTSKKSRFFPRRLVARWFASSSRRGFGGLSTVPAAFTAGAEPGPGERVGRGAAPEKPISKPHGQSTPPKPRHLKTSQSQRQSGPFGKNPRCSSMV